MSISVQILYPRGEGTTFDYDYFVNSHMKLVSKHWGAFMEGSSVVRGLSGGPDTPPAWYLTATLRFADMDAMQKALADSDAVNADVPNYTNTKPSLLIGEVIA
jgi:uncharacterized protein (TIGR02118 family)